MISLRSPGAIGLGLDELDTPALILDLDVLRANLDRMAQLFAKTSVRLRPHAKTHKTPNIALMQLERGAIGIACAKLGEAEVLAAGGVRGLLLTTEVVGDTKIRRLVGVSKQVAMTVVVDDFSAAERISDAATAAGLRLDCLVDVNVGQNRTGIEPGEAALNLARKIQTLKGLTLTGLQGYEGHLQFVAEIEERRRLNAQSMQLLTHTASLLAENGLRVDVVSTAGTGTCQMAAGFSGITEVQPGSYIVMDTQYNAVQGVDFKTSLTVLTSVVSVNRPNAVIVDAGYKAVSTDAGQPKVRGMDGDFTTQGDEHGKITFASGNPLSLGDRVELLPSHCDTTINLYDVYHVVSEGRVIALWPILGRGRTQ